MSVLAKSILSRLSFIELRAKQRLWHRLFRGCKNTKKNRIRKNTPYDGCHTDKPASLPQRSSKAVSAPYQHWLLSACCPLDVRLLSAFKADIKRTSSGQQADNNRSGYVQVLCYVRFMVWAFRACFSVCYVLKNYFPNARYLRFFMYFCSLIGLSSLN